jgi:GxxExxY protein
MPIVTPVPLRLLHQEEFARIDYRVMRCAFDAQNDLGRLCDEVIYQSDLALRLEAAGLGPVRREVPVTVTHGDFTKTYRLDLVVNDGAIYELKTEARLAVDHDTQLLNYLFLCETQHGKLVNFRPAQVESRFVNTTLSLRARRDFRVDTLRWQEADDVSRTLRTGLLGILEDWGGFLDLALYTEALTHFLGGEAKVVQQVALTRAGVPLGNQRVHLAGPDVAFRLTALAEGTEEYAPHLQGLLRHSPLRAIQWINLGRHHVRFVTLTK